MDRLTMLPEDVKRIIISRLSATDAVRLSLMSREWRSLCSSLENLIFEEDHFPKIDRRFEQFMAFIGQTLNCRASCYIKMLRIKFCDCDRSSIALNPAAWIAAAAEHRVESLDMSLPIHIDDVIGLCQCLFTCRSLKYLRLEALHYQRLDLPVSVCLPSLIDLTLFAVALAYEYEMQQILSGCPMLERLVIKRCYVPFDLTFSTTVGSRSVPKLKRLEIVGCHHIDVCIISFQMPIHSLLYEGCLARNYHYGSDISIAHGDINLCQHDSCGGLRAPWDHMVQRLSRLFAGLQHVRSFDANLFFSWVLSIDYRQRRLSRVRYAHSLQQLYILMWPTKEHLEMLLMLLAEMRHLKELHMTITRKGLLPQDIQHLVEESEFVFSGDLNNLKHIHIYNFEGLESEMLMVKHLLRICATSSLTETQVEIKCVTNQEGGGQNQLSLTTPKKFKAIAEKLLHSDGCMQDSCIICDETHELVPKRKLYSEHALNKRARLW